MIIITIYIQNPELLVGVTVEEGISVEVGVIINVKWYITNNDHYLFHK